MTNTLVQLHFVRDRINHRLRFGQPAETIRLDKCRKIASFKPSSIFGYIRWRANEYGTQDWRVYILKSQSVGIGTHVTGVSPATKVLLSVIGKDAVKRVLPVIDTLETQAAGGLQSIPESYWQMLHNGLLLRKKPRELPLSCREMEASHVS